jgi:hypothetical protein
LQQIQKDGSEEPGMVTTGDDLTCVRPYLVGDKASYRAADVVRLLMSQVETQVAQESSAHIFATQNLVEVLRS